MELCLLEVKHRYDEDYEVVGIFFEEDVDKAKATYLRDKKEAGLNEDEFDFRKRTYVLGQVEM